MSARSVWCGVVEKLRPAFSRRRTFLWFLAAIAAFAIREDLNGVTSFVRVLGLDPVFYHALSRMFHSSGVDVAKLATLCMSTDLELDALETVKLYSLRFKIELGFKIAKHVTGGVLYHFWMRTMDRLGRNPKTQCLHRKSEEYRKGVRRKLRAYHCFLQTGVIAQGLMTAIGILAADYCRANYSSRMRTMYISRTPSEWVVQHVLRKTFTELLADTAHIPDWAKFILRGWTRGDSDGRPDGFSPNLLKIQPVHCKTPDAHAAGAKLDGFTPQGENPSLSILQQTPCPPHKRV